MSSLLDKVKAKQRVYRVPYLLPRLNIVREESARTTIPTFIEMGSQHNYRRFGRWRHTRHFVGSGGQVLVAFGVGNCGVN